LFAESWPVGPWSLENQHDRGRDICHQALGQTREDTAELARPELTSALAP
jgi:hypothetical protein